MEENQTKTPATRKKTTAGMVSDCDTSTIEILSKQRHLYESGDMDLLRPLFIGAHTIKPGMEAELDEALKQISQKIVVESQNTENFLRSHDYKVLCKLFPDAPDWFNEKVKDPHYILIASTLAKYIRHCLPFMGAVMEDKFPGWEPGAVSFYEVIPDLALEKPDFSLLDAMLEAANGSPAPEAMRDIQAELQAVLSQDKLPLTCTDPTDPASYYLFHPSFIEARKKALETVDVTGGYVQIPVFHKGRAGREVSVNVRLDTDGPLHPTDRDVLFSVMSVYLAMESIGQLLPDGSVAMTINDIYRDMRGGREVSANEAAVKEIEAALIRLMRSMVDIDDVELQRFLARHSKWKNGDPMNISESGSKGPLIPGMLRWATVNGHSVRCLIVTSQPPLLEYVSRSGQYVNFSRDYINVQAVNKKTGLPTGGPVPATSTRAAIWRHMARRVQGINLGYECRGKRKKKHGALDSPIIKLDDFFDRLAIPNEGKEQRRSNREDVTYSLDYLKSLGAITDWKFINYDEKDRKRGKRGKGRVLIFPKGYDPSENDPLFTV